MLVRKSKGKIPRFPAPWPEWNSYAREIITFWGLFYAGGSQPTGGTQTTPCVHFTGWILKITIFCPDYTVSASFCAFSGHKLNNFFWWIFLKQINYWSFGESFLVSFFRVDLNIFQEQFFSLTFGVDLTLYSRWFCKKLI